VNLLTAAFVLVQPSRIEPGKPIARVKENDGPVDRDDSFQVDLAASGSAYTRFVVNAAGFLLEDTGFFGSPPLSRAREWNSAALSPRPLLIEDFVDGRNRVEQEAGLHQRLAQVFLSYSESSAPLAYSIGEGATGLGFMVG